MLGNLMEQKEEEQRQRAAAPDMVGDDLSEHGGGRTRACMRNRLGGSVRAG
jgi:hypothetical protein